MKGVSPVCQGLHTLLASTTIGRGPVTLFTPNSAVFFAATVSTVKGATLFGACGAHFGRDSCPPTFEGGALFKLTEKNRPTVSSRESLGQAEHKQVPLF